LQRALALEPRLSVAHKYLAALESEIGAAPTAVVRLLREAARHGNDPELFAGLVQTCRFCGLYDEAIAAHAEARRLDPNIATSVEQTLLMTTNFDLLFSVEPAGVGGADEGIRVMALALAGRREEARQSLLVMRQAMTLPAFQSWTDYLMAWIDRRVEAMRAKIAVLNGLKIQDDPEAMFVEAWMFCEVGDHDTGLRLLQRSVRKGYFAAPTLARSRHFDALRSNAEFLAVQAEADAGRNRALEAFRDAGGERLLGLQQVRGAA
jgi:hypothetical protein